MRKIFIITALMAIDTKRLLLSLKEILIFAVGFFVVFLLFNLNKGKEEDAPYWAIFIMAILELIRIMLIPLIIKEHKRKVRGRETLKQSILTRCNPKNFMKPFDKDKIELANKLYAQTLNTPETDTDTLRNIRIEAEDGLSVSFVDERNIASLKSFCNPQKYMKHYDPQKVSLAIELYSILSSDKINVDTFDEVKKRSEDLKRNK